MELLYKTETFQIIGACMEVHRNLGPGFLEIVYKDALELELKNRNISFQREAAFNVQYKNTTLPHKFYVDFLINDKVILEVKAVSSLNEIHQAQLINYLKVSKRKIGLLVNFSELSLNYRRLVY